MSSTVSFSTLALAGAGLAAIAALVVIFGKKGKKPTNTGKPGTPASSSSKAAAQESGKPVLEPGVWQAFKLTEKEHLTVNVPCPVTRFRFALPTPNSTLGLPIGQHISLRCTNPATQKPHQRSYTPTSSNDDKGYFDLVIKIYPTGVLGQYLTHLPIGGTIDVSGPKGRFTYKPNEFSNICMIAGGSGITPMYQVAREIVKNASVDKTRAHLIFGNVTEADIILRKELDEMAEKYPESFTVYHVLNQPHEDNWTQGTGFISQEHIKARFPPADTPKLKVVLCGPPPMLTAMQKNLGELGYTPEQIFQF